MAMARGSANFNDNEGSNNTGGVIRYFIPWKGDKSSEVVRKIVFIASVGLFCVSLGQLKSYLNTTNGERSRAHGLVEQYEPKFDENVDYAPTITPVIDLTQLNNGMNTTRGLLAELNNAKTGISAALDISTAHNDSLAKAKERANRNYSGDLQKLVEGLRTLNQTAKQNNVAVIDGDYLFGYMNTRLGAAYSY